MAKLWKKTQPDYNEASGEDPAREREGKGPP